jgi:hypothetical protein
VADVPTCDRCGTTENVEDRYTEGYDGTLCDQCATFDLHDGGGSG